MLLQRILCSSFFINIIQTSFTNHWKRSRHPPCNGEAGRLSFTWEVHGKAGDRGSLLLQFRKCKDQSCGSLLCKELPPSISASVLHPNGDHFLKCNETYGLLGASEKDRPSLQKTGKEKKTKNPAEFKFLASRVVAMLICCQCGKRRCVFCHNNKIAPEGQCELDEIMYSCGTQLKSRSIYMANQLKRACAEKAGWRNVRRKSWLCLEHKYS